jgi:hypothetical protein
MAARPMPWMLCLTGVLVAACAAGGAVWYARRPIPAPPPVPNLSARTEDDSQTDAGPTLPEADREFLWDIEHHGNLLNTYGFSKLADALRDADATALGRLVADNFTGEVPTQPRLTSVRNECVEVVRQEDTGQPPTQLGRESFVAHLLEYRRAFSDKPPRVQLILKTLLPRRGRDLDGPWQGVAQLRLHGESRPGQPCEVVVLLGYEVARPSKATLAQPGWLRAASIRQSLIAHASRYLMAEVAKERGLNPTLFHDNWLQDPTSPSSRMIATGGVFVCDFDGDGILDVLITDVNRYALYRGRPDGQFVDVTAEMGLPQLPLNSNALSGVACWIDIDGDGWPDLILADRVFRNDHGKQFVDYTSRTNLRLPLDTAALVVADYDCDGKLDLYATRTGSGTARSWLDGLSGPDAGNHLFHNLGNWQFADVTQASHTQAGRRSSFTAVWLDAKNDGWPDLHVINEFGDGVLLENLHDGTFREHALGPPPVDFGTMGVAAGDIDNDGNIDLYCADMYSKAGARIIGNLPAGTYPDTLMARLRRFIAGSQLHLNKGGFRFEQAGERMQVNAVGWAYGPVLADLDNDGWLDIYATSGQISRDRAKPDG